MEETKTQFKFAILAAILGTIFYIQGNYKIDKSKPKYELKHLTDTIK